MGHFLYGTPPEQFELDDRTLAHVEIVMLAKLRRNENFAFVLDYPSGGRSTLWVSTHSALQFRLDDHSHEINREWLEVLIDSANSPGGLRITPEGE